jgi:hypothetical protein
MAPLTANVAPTLAEYWTAADLVYADNREGKGSDLAPPASSGLTLLLDSGAVNSKWLSDGFFAQALEDTSSGDIIIAFEGSRPFEGSVYGRLRRTRIPRFLRDKRPTHFQMHSPLQGTCNNTSLRIISRPT